MPDNKLEVSDRVRFFDHTPKGDRVEWHGVIVRIVGASITVSVDTEEEGFPKELRPIVRHNSLLTMSGDRIIGPVT